MQEDIEVASRASASSAFTFAAQTQARSIVDAGRNLDRDFADFFLDTRNNLESVLNKAVVEVSRFTVETVLELDRYLVFADNRKGKKLKKIFDYRFPRLVKSGEIERLFAKWNW